MAEASALRVDSIDIRIGADAPPWRLTFEFLNDVHTVLRQTWLANRPDDDFELVIVDLSEGSKRFKGEVRSKPGKHRKPKGATPVLHRAEHDMDLAERVDVQVSTTQRVEVPSAPADRREIGPRDLLAAGAIVLAGVISAVGGNVRVMASPGSSVPDIPVVPVHPERGDRMQRYVTLHAENVVIEITPEGGPRMVVTLGDVDASLREDVSRGLDLVEIPDDVLVDRPIR